MHPRLEAAGCEFQKEVDDFVQLTPNSPVPGNLPHAVRPYGRNAKFWYRRLRGTRKRPIKTAKAVSGKVHQTKTTFTVQLRRVCRTADRFPVPTPA